MSPALVGRFLPTVSPGKSNPAHSSGFFFFFYQLLGAGVLNWALGCRGSRIETVGPGEGGLTDSRNCNRVERPWCLKRGKNM